MRAPDETPYEVCAAGVELPADGECPECGSTPEDGECWKKRPDLLEERQWRAWEEYCRLKKAKWKLES